MSAPPVVTFDLFSALLDSRAGGSATFARLARSRGWPVGGEQVYDRWDAANKRAHLHCAGWAPYAELARSALADAYAALGLDGDPAADPVADLDQVLDSLPDWPLWPDVAAGLPVVAAAGYRLGLLSNVDDAIFARTRAAGLFEPALALTSQQLRAYKPASRIYTAARERLGPMVHVPTSARDVRGALEAGLPAVRLRRPGHQLDPAGPRPAYETDSVAALPALLAEALAEANRPA